MSGLCVCEAHLVALLRLVVAVGVGEVDVAARLLHHLLDVVPSLPDDVGVLRVGYVHLQGDPVALCAVGGETDSQVK